MWYVITHYHFLLLPLCQFANNKSQHADDYSELLTAPNEFEAEDNAINQQSKITTSRIIDDSMTATTKKFLNKEKVQAHDFMTNEANEQLLKEHQKKKEEMLKSLLEQQKIAEDAVNKIQLEKDVERRKLIDDIMECKWLFAKFIFEIYNVFIIFEKFVQKYNSSFSLSSFSILKNRYIFKPKITVIFLDEESSTVVVNELLSLKKGPDPALLELEDKARDALLEKVREKLIDIK